MKVYLNSSRRNAPINEQIEEVLRKLELDAFLPCKMTRQDLPHADIFQRNIEAIRQADVMVVVLAEYGKDTAAEVGIAYGLGVRTIGVDFNADPDDIMMYFALDAIVKPHELENALRRMIDGAASSDSARSAGR